MFNNFHKFTLFKMDLFVVVVEAVQLTSTVQGVLFYVIKN